MMEMPSPCDICGEIVEFDDLTRIPGGTKMICKECAEDLNPSNWELIS